MTNGTASVHRRRFGIVLSAVIILAGLCLMVSCAGIYFSGGEEPYSREAVAAAFSPIAIPVYLCLAMILAGAVLQLIRPLPAEKVVSVRQHSVLLRRAAARADLENCDAALKEQILAERSRRRKQSMVCAAALILCAAIFLIHALNGSNFHNSDINGSMIRAMWVLVPCLVIAFGVCIATVRARCAGMSRETELLKQCPKKETAAETATGSAQNMKYVLLLAGIALLVFGFCTGGTADVLTKAVNICTECIGLG